MAARWIYTHVALPGPVDDVAALVRREGRTLVRRGLGIGRGGVEPGGQTDLLLDEHVGAGLATRRTPVRLVLGEAVDHHVGLRLACRWEAAGPDAFSTFEGAFEVSPVPTGGTELALAGRYVLPDGDPGAHAEATDRLARHLVRSLSGELSRLLAEPRPAARLLGPRRLHVGDLMTPDPVVVDEGASVRIATLLLLHHEVGAVPVVDDGDRVIGVLSESDLLAREAAPRVRGGVAARDETRRRLARTAGESASRPAVTTSPDTTVKEAARLLLDADVGRLVVVDEHGRAIGVLSRHDVLRALTRNAAHLEAVVEAELAAAGQPFLRVEVGDAGRVALVGSVASAEEAARVVAVTAAVDGVVDVDGDRLRVTVGAY